MKIKDFSTTHLNKLIPFVELFSKALSFISVIIITRLLSVESFGVYYYIISIVAWASVFMDGGISYYIINKSVKDDISNLGEYLVSRVLFSLITIIFLCVVAGFIKQQYVLYILLYGLSFLFILLTAFFKIIARTQGKVTLDFTTIIAEPLIRVVVLIVLYFTVLNISLTLVFTVLLFTALVGFVLSFFYFKNQIPLKINPKIEFQKTLAILKETKWYLLMYLFLVGLKRVEIVILKFRFNDYESGLYSSADNFYNSAYLFFTALILVGIKKHFSADNIRKRKNTLYLIGLSLLSVMVLYFFSDIFYTLFYSVEYLEGHHLLSILALSLLFSPFNYYFILKNNYNHNINVNIRVLGISFFIKILIAYYVLSLKKGTNLNR